jgi:predicted esterase
MQSLTFNELQTQIEELYQEGKFAAALDSATEQFEHFPQHRHLLYYWRIVMSARLGDNDQSLDLLQEALNAGVWYGEVLLRKSPSLQALQGDLQFERLVELNQEMRQKDQQESFPLLTLRPEDKCQAGSDPCPLLLALHANASNAQGSMGFWQPAASAGWLVAAPQSTQAMWSGAYVWDDRSTSEREIKKHFATLKRQYAIDPLKTVLAGHSMGGEIAIWLALKGETPACGFIAFGPGGPYMDDLTKWESLLFENPTENLRGYLIFGEDDDSISQENVVTLGAMLNDHGIPCEIEEVPAAAHEFIPAYEATLLHALNFVLQNSD